MKDNVDYDLEKLKNAYLTHNSIIIGLDFDDTIFPLNDVKFNVNRCEAVIKTVTEFQVRFNCTICLYTNADEQSLIYKKFIAERCFGLKIDYVNESPVLSDNGKPFFNILLDDKSGLNESLERLNKLMS